ncbi:acyltransferase family protein [Massilia sp.]|uniref:acyltransferase family protein n=1 Tax=Massilia sp. TaxID=1882437 RepID=UPI0028981780|nr:acyltransferase family protein [Massilia sp.]
MHTPTSTPRLLFLDWLRIIAFFILVLYHVGMYYVSWDWHVKSDFASPGLEPFMLLSSPWRLGLLFLVGGAAAAMSLRRLGGRAFLRRRSLRLLLPLLFGMLVVVPPQSYFEVVEDLGFGGGYLRFMALYVQGYQDFCDGDGCLFLPTWNHLWFVPYLWAYGAVLVLLAAGGARLSHWANAAAAQLHGWKLIVLPAACLALARVSLLREFGETHMFVNDPFNHATYLFLFLLGALFAHAPHSWTRFVALRWHALALALTGWAAIVIWRALWKAEVPGIDFEAMFAPMATVYATTAWSAIAAACGFGARHLERDGPARRYLVEAVFPVYIVHQTLIVALAHWLKPARLAPGIEGVLLTVLTLTLSFAIFEAVRRIKLLRPLFGLPFGRKTRPGTKLETKMELKVEMSAKANAETGP